MHSSFLRVVKNAAVAAVVSFGFAAEGFAGWTYGSNTLTENVERHDPVLEIECR